MSKRTAVDVPVLEHINPTPNASPSGSFSRQWWIFAAIIPDHGSDKR